MTPDIAWRHIVELGFGAAVVLFILAVGICALSDALERRRQQQEASRG